MGRYHFTRGETYTRRSIREALGLDPRKLGGDWSTGLVVHEGAHFIMCNVGTAGRTGHNYENRFEGGVLNWSGRTGSRLTHPSIRAMLGPEAEIHVFYREKDRAPFTYAGIGVPARTESTVPVRIVWAFPEPTGPGEGSPQEAGADRFYEGGKVRVWVNKYERDRDARVACIRHHGTACQVCTMQFSEVYGQIGDDFIHVHHLTPISSVGPSYEVNPLGDLVPVCPNCHSMLHRREPPFTIDEMRSFLGARATKR